MRVDPSQYARDAFERACKWEIGQLVYSHAGPTWGMTFYVLLISQDRGWVRLAGPQPFYSSYYNAEHLAPLDLRTYPPAVQRVPTPLRERAVAPLRTQRKIDLEDP